MRDFLLTPSYRNSVTSTNRIFRFFTSFKTMVEMGFERLAEVQEQILWLCEATHVPVIWATQVLESLAKKGMPSRAEVTDAAMSGRAECVMLNKGPHVLDAVRFLDNVMTRMQRHQAKKRAVLRKLSVSDRIVDSRTTG